MIASSSWQSIVVPHVLQFSIAIFIVACLMGITSRRWPHFTFLVCMLALLKCLVPPVITSPAGLFTRHSGVAFSPQLQHMEADQVVRLKQTTFASSAGWWQTYQTQATRYQPTLAWTGIQYPGRLVSRDWMFVLLYGWVCGGILVLGRASWQYLRLLRLIRRSRPASSNLVALTGEIQQQLGSSRKVQVLVSDQNFGPACVGFWRPKLILPSQIADGWSGRLLRPVVAHEMAHTRRGDILWGYLQFVAQIVWWFHPLVWWLGRRAHLLCERCCDDEVIASTTCRRADYAESLVRVLELKSSLRAVPLCHAISPAEITSQRLERLMKRCGEYSPAKSKVGWIATALLAAIILPGMQWATAQDGQTTEEEKVQYRSQINQAIASSNWEEAIELLRPVVERDPKNGGALFYLGYALHAKGDLEEALEYHRKAARFPNMKPVALYNCACALALMGEHDQALEQLTAAMDAGFVHESDLRDDPDLKSLFERSEFKALRERTTAQQKAKKKLREFDFWVGEWSVVNAAGDVVGTNRITASDNGHVITEKWTSRSGGTGTSINYYHPEQEQWRQTWVDAEGGVIEYRGKFSDGKMQFEGEMFQPNGTKLLSRMTFTPNSDGTVEQFIENSEDGGKTWTTYFKGTYQPKPVPQKHELTDA